MLIITWQEDRRIYPDQFVKFEIVESHKEGNKEIYDEVAMITPLADGKEAMKEFVHRTEGHLVYSTKMKRLLLNL